MVLWVVVKLEPISLSLTDNFLNSNGTGLQICSTQPTVRYSSSTLEEKLSLDAMFQVKESLLRVRFS